MEVILWLVMAAVLIVVEIATLGLTTVWFAGGAIIAAVAAYLDCRFKLQLLIFAIVSLVLLIFTRPIAKKHLDSNIQATNIDSLIGKAAKALQDFDAETGYGRVDLKGMEWSATSAEREPVKKGDVLEVKAIEGNRLIVSLKKA